MSNFGDRSYLELLQLLLQHAQALDHLLVVGLQDSDLVALSIDDLLLGHVRLVGAMWVEGVSMKVELVGIVQGLLDIGLDHVAEDVLQSDLSLIHI